MKNSSLLKVVAPIMGCFAVVCGLAFGVTTATRSVIESADTAYVKSQQVLAQANELRDASAVNLAVTGRIPEDKLEAFFVLTDESFEHPTAANFDSVRRFAAQYGSENVAEGQGQGLRSLESSVARYREFSAKVSAAKQAYANYANGYPQKVVLTAFGSV